MTIGLLFGRAYMDIGELHESLEGTKNYHGGTSC